MGIGLKKGFRNVFFCNAQSTGQQGDMIATGGNLYFHCHLASGCFNQNFLFSPPGFPWGDHFAIAMPDPQEVMESRIKEKCGHLHIYCTWLKFNKKVTERKLIYMLLHF
jgi:hypothetical protein